MRKNIRNRTKVYSSASQLKKPKEFFKSMYGDFFSSMPLAWRLLKRDINASYRQTLLGYFWLLLPPVIVAYGLVSATKAKVISVGVTDLPYPAYVMLSMVLWQTFVDSLNAPIKAVSESKTMLAKINFPREAIVLAKVGEVCFNFFIKLVLIALLFVFYDMPITWKLAVSPVGVFMLIILGLFFGLLLAPLSGVYQDFSRGVVMITTPWLLLTPVLYPVPKEGFLSLVVNINPVTSILVTTRELATIGEVSNLENFLIVSVIALAGMVITWIFFRLAMPYVIERLPS